MRKQTPSMTIGPFFAFGLEPSSYGHPEPVHNVLAIPDVPGKHIILSGRVLDAKKAPIDDALVEIWHADASGKYPAKISSTSMFRGHGRCSTRKNGEFSFMTIKPGTLGDSQAPHVNVVLFARGLLNHMFTRIYFDDEIAANAKDPVLQRAGRRRHTLIAAHRQLKNGVMYCRDIILSGKNQTTFLDI